MQDRDNDPPTRPSGEVIPLEGKKRVKRRWKVLEPAARNFFLPLLHKSGSLCRRSYRRRSPNQSSGYGSQRYSPTNPWGVTSKTLAT